MDFEAFFEKKKINLQKFEADNVILFEKLKKEYPEMGAKSFDHYYKFLFNKWRKAYPCLVN